MDFRCFGGLHLFLFNHQAFIWANTAASLLLKSVKGELSACGFH